MTSLFSTVLSIFQKQSDLLRYALPVRHRWSGQPYRVPRNTIALIGRLNIDSGARAPKLGIQASTFVTIVSVGPLLLLTVEEMVSTILIH